MGTKTEPENTQTRVAGATPAVTKTGLMGEITHDPPG